MDLPGLSVQPGGTATMEVTQKVVDVHYMARKLHEISTILPEQMLFVASDGVMCPLAIGPGHTVRVKNLDETITAIAAMFACLS